MKLFLMPKEPTWWVWLITVVLLAVGLAGHPAGFIAATALSAMQSVFFLMKHRSLAPHAVQIRVAYTALLLLCLLPSMRWLFWLPTLGTAAMLVFGYCLMARVLSLMPWNRRVPLTAPLAWRTFFSAPVISRVPHGSVSGGCPGGVCELETQAAAQPQHVL